LINKNTNHTSVPK